MTGAVSSGGMLVPGIKAAATSDDENAIKSSHVYTFQWSENKASIPDINDSNSSWSLDTRDTINLRSAGLNQTKRTGVSPWISPGVIVASFWLAGGGVEAEDMVDRGAKQQNTVNRHAQVEVVKIKITPSI